MSVEYGLKELGIVTIDFFDYPANRDYNGESDWVTMASGDKIVFKGTNDLCVDKLVNIIDIELNEGRMVINSLLIKMDQLYHLNYKKLSRKKFKLS